MIKRPSIIVTSLGRTGTKFFSVLFKDIIPHCDSFHEPDIVQTFGTQDHISPFIQRVKDAGVYNMVFLKLLGKWSLISISDARLRGELSKQQAANEVLRQRAGFVNSKTGSVYVETNAGYYGLIDVLNGVYENHRLVFIVRDGREWVSSEMNVKELYAKKGLRKLLSHKMPAAAQFPGDPLSTSWQTISRFEKLCWAWAKLNEYALSTISKNPQARLFHFEEIFRAETRYQTLNELVSFATSMPGIEHQLIGSTVGRLEQKIHQSSNEFPAWEKWSVDQKRHFEKICGPLMEKAGYTF